MPLSSLIFLEVSAVLCSITSKAILQDTIRCYILLCHYCTFKSPISNCPFCKLCSSLLCTSQIPCVLICVPQRSWEEGKPIIITTKLCRRASLLNLEKKMSYSSRRPHLSDWGPHLSVKTKTLSLQFTWTHGQQKFSFFEKTKHCKPAFYLNFSLVQA